MGRFCLGGGFMEIPGCGNLVDQGSVLEWKLDVEIPMKATYFEIFQDTAPERLVVVELLAMAADAAVNVLRVFALLVETLPDLGLLQDRPRLPARTPPQSDATAADRCRWLADAGAAAADFQALQRTLSG